MPLGRFSAALGSLLRLSCLFLSSSGSPDSPSRSFFPIWHRCLAILSYNFDVRSFKNIGLTIGKPTCCIRVFAAEDGIESVIGVSSAPFCSYWGPLGRLWRPPGCSWGSLRASSGVPRLLLDLMFSFLLSFCSPLRAPGTSRIFLEPLRIDFVIPKWTLRASKTLVFVLR